MSQATLEKLIIFETHFPTYDSDEIRALSVEEVLTPMIKALNSQMKSVMSHIKALKNPDDDVMHILNVVSAMDLMKMHLEFTIAVLESNSEEEVTALKENKFALIRDQYENVKSKKDLSTVPAKYVVAMMHDKVLTELKKVLKKCFKQNKFGETELVNKEENVARIRVIVGRFELCYTSYPVTITFPEDDIIRLEKTAPIWQELHEMVIFKQMVTKQEVHSTSRLFHLGVHLSHIINNNQIRNRKNPYIKAALSLVQEIVYYGFQYAQIETQALLYLLKPDVNEAFKAWNLPEVPWVSKTLALVAPFVAVDRRIFIPRIFPKITRQTIQKEYEDGTINKVVLMDPKDLVAPDLGYDRCAILEELFTESEEKVPVRILSHENLNLEENGTNLFQFMAQKARKLLPFMAPPKEDEEKAIVIHMHGGGFVAMSSATHRIYLTTWVKKLKMVHFSIDYRNAPENKYPAAVDDVWQAYLWITNYATSVLGIKYKKVILVGDSSGATLALSLMYRLIRAGLPVPHGCLLFYPALILDSTVASPSYFESLDDPLLPYSLLKLIIEAYLDPECRRREDPFISPLVACDEFLEKLPPLRIITGSKDPLYDDNWKFLQRLKKLKKDVRMIVHAHLSHGYICHKMLKKYNSFLDEACDMIKELTSLGS